MTDIVPGGYVTLREAFDRCGKRHYGEAWTGGEAAAIELATNNHDDPEECGAQKRGDHARRELLGAFYDGRPQTWLMDATMGDLLPIPQQRWLGSIFQMSFCHSCARWKEVIDPSHPLGIVPISGKVFIKEADLEAFLNQPIGDRVASTGAAEADCRKLIAQRAASGEVPANRDALFVEARAMIGPSLSRRAFNRVWAVTAPNQWKKPGRKAGRKSRHRIDTPT